MNYVKLKFKKNKKCLKKCVKFVFPKIYKNFFQWVFTFQFFELESLEFTTLKLIQVENPSLSKVSRLAIGISRVFQLLIISKYLF